MSPGLIAGTGWASGINLYGVAALLGIFGRLGVGDTPELLQRPWVIGIALALYAGEFVADKIPYLDNVWDVAHTAIRPLGAAGLGYLLGADGPGAGQIGAAAGSGVLALTSHTAKATTRAAVNASPEPFSNIAISLGEDGLVAGMIALAVTHPWIALALVVVLVIAGAALTIALWRTARGLVRRVRERRAAHTA